MFGTSLRNCFTGLYTKQNHLWVPVSNWFKGHLEEITSYRWTFSLQKEKLYTAEDHLGDIF